MKSPTFLQSKIYSQQELIRQMNVWRFLGKTVAFTNGCFDILHEGHIFSLSEAANEADILIVAVNSDKSVNGLKGPGRPVNNEHSRAMLLAALFMVDAVILFEEETPQQLIAKLLPDVLVKGGDYTVEQIAGAKEVIANGGKVVINPIVKGFSTTGIIEKIQSL
jgi:D-glycero-beta-D-manno-heptose 1-phosphate adenylyltransferase